MKFPIKPHDGFWPNWLRPLLGAHLRKDPRLLLQSEKLSDEAFSRAVSNFRLGGTFKTTRPGRHSRSNEMLRHQKLPPNAIILELGASDGITSLELMQALDFQFKRYYVTDRFPEIKCIRENKHCFFFDTENQCVLITDDFFVYYPRLSPLARKRYGRHIKRLEAQLREHKITPLQIPLIHPRLQRERARRPDQIHIRTHHVLTPWQGEQPSLIKAANLLNFGYFTKKQIGQALKLIFEALPEKGLFLLVENRIPSGKGRTDAARQEAAVLWQKCGNKFRCLEKIGPQVQLNVAKLLGQIR